MTTRPESCWVFFTKGHTLLNVLTSWTTWRPGLPLKRTPAHAGIGFHLYGGKEVYYEAIAGAGWTGPWAVNHLNNYASSGRGWVRKIPVNHITADQVQKIYDCAEWARGHWSYPIKQLWMMYLFQRFGAKIIPSPNQAVCSEGVARCLQSAGINIHKLVGVHSPDYVSPRHLLDGIIAWNNAGSARPGGMQI